MKSRKDKCYHEVTLSLISEKHEKESQRWNTRVSEKEKNFDEKRGKSKENLYEAKALLITIHINFTSKRFFFERNYHKK